MGGGGGHEPHLQPTYNMLDHSTLVYENSICTPNRLMPNNTEHYKHAKPLHLQFQNRFYTVFSATKLNQYKQTNNAIHSGVVG